MTTRQQLVRELLALGKAQELSADRRLDALLASAEIAGLRGDQRARWMKTKPTQKERELAASFGVTVQELRRRGA